MTTIKDWYTLKKLAKKYHLEFDKKFKYYIGNPYRNSKDETLPNYMTLSASFDAPVYMLKYFDGCFNPFVVAFPKKDFWLYRENYEPAFPYDKTIAHRIDQTKYIKL